MEGEVWLQATWLLVFRGYLRGLDRASFSDGQLIEATAAPVGHVHVPRLSPCEFQIVSAFTHAAADRTRESNVQDRLTALPKPCQSSHIFLPSGPYCLR